jgi:DNA-binding response OmpR family regulator
MNIGLFSNRRTILIIDDDAHARAALRLALEAAGFSVGEAANDHEGERALKRCKIDAVLYDPIAGTTVGAATITERLHVNGSSLPCYIISTAAEALIGSVGLHELGIVGIFLKPLDVKIVIRTLKTRLVANEPAAGDA